MRTPVLFDTNHPFKWQKYSFLHKQIVNQNVCSAPLTFRIFSSSWKSFVYWCTLASHLWNVYCLLLSDKISCCKKLHLQLCSFKRYNNSFPVRELLIKVSIMHCSHLAIFFFGTSFVYRHALQVVFFPSKFCLLAGRFAQTVFIFRRKTLSFGWPWLAQNRFLFDNGNCWSVYPRFHNAESSKLSIQRQYTLSFNGVLGLETNSSQLATD